MRQLGATLREPNYLSTEFKVHPPPYTDIVVYIMVVGTCTETASAECESRQSPYWSGEKEQIFQRTA